VRVRAVIVAALVTLVVAGRAVAAAPPVDAAAYLVASGATGEVVASRAADTRVPIASITKLMTVLVALDHLRLDEVVTVREEAAAIGESTVNLHAGERITVRDLVKAALIQSANDAAGTLADAAAGGDTTRFVGWMNARAAALGLRSTHFARPDGLDAPGHLSTARDVLRLAQVAMRVPAIRDAVRERTDTISGGRHLHTWNDLLGTLPGLVGVKTGHTGGAGWCEVAAVRRPGYMLYAVVLGSPTRAVRNDALRSLLTWGAGRFRVVHVIFPRRVYAATQTGYGRDPLALVAPRPLTRVVRVDRPLVERVVAAGAVAPPVRRGQVLGSVQVWSGKRLVGTQPLVAARAVSRPGLGGRIAWYAGRTVHNVLGVFG
jgi:D-alanyl-D-alanine carboxypeptidase (penicillin-binding protein 5/6)